MNSETAAYSTEAHQLALSTGASAPDLENLCSREALLSILTDANIEQDICEDVCDTCELSNLNALTIASGLLSVEQVAKFCFLTKDEAEVVLSHCAHKAFHAGVKFGRASVADPIRLGTFRKSPKAAEAASPKAFAADDDGNSSTFGGDSLKFDSPSKRGHRARPPVETTGKSIEAVSIVETDKDGALSVSSPHRKSVHSHDPFSPKKALAGVPATSNAFSITNSQVVPPPDSSADQEPQTDIASEPQPDNLAGTGVSTTSSSAPSTIPTPSVASAKSSINRIAPVSLEAGDGFREARTSGTEPMPVVSAPASSAAAAPSPLPVSSGQPEFSVPASDLVAPSISSTQIRSEDESKHAVPQRAAHTESGPNSPKTPRDATAREMLKVESCQLNTSSTVPPQRDNSVGNAIGTPATSALPSPSAVTPSALPGAAVPDLQGGGQQFAVSPSAYGNVPPPRSAPDISSVRRSAPAQQEVATSKLANGAISGLPTPLRSPRGRPPPPQTESSVKSAWASPRPVTPPARGRQGRPQTAGSVYPQEGLDELGSTFLKYPGVLPSFMRPTAAHERRLNAAGEDSRESARTPSPPRRQARSVNPTARFIQPTASYSAKATTPIHVASTPIGRPRTPMVRAHSAAPAAMRGHKPTSFAPFCLHTEMRLPQRNRKTTDELRVAEAKKAKEAEILRRRQQLQRLQKQERARTASPKVSEESSSTHTRSRNVKPFQLASVMRHEREVQNRKQQLQRQLEEEARAKQFRARQFNPAMFSCVQPRARRSEPGRQSVGGGRGTPGRPVSGIKPPGHRQSYRQERLEDEFSNEATMARRAMVIAREEEKKQEAAQAAREREFKSRMGSKSGPRSESEKAKPTTIPKPFRLSTSKVVHTLFSEKESTNTQNPPTQLCTPQTVMSEFARSLQASREG